MRISSPTVRYTKPDISMSARKSLSEISAIEAHKKIAYPTDRYAQRGKGAVKPACAETSSRALIFLTAVLRKNSKQINANRKKAIFSRCPATISSEAEMLKILRKTPSREG